MKLTMLFLKINLLVISMLCVGCTVGPRYCPPEPDVSCDWHSNISEGMQTIPPDCFLWWEALNDPILNWLIERAYEQNLDLYIATTRILEAREERKGKMAERYPHLDASMTYGHVYYSKDALVNGLLGTAIPIDSNAPIKRNVNFYEIGFDADWELDLFGKLAHDIKAQDANLEAQEEQLCDIWVTLSAEVARNYIELRGLQQRLIILNNHIADLDVSYRLIRELNKIGSVSEIDLLQAQEQLCTTTAQKPFIQLSIDKAIHRLSILLAYCPGELFEELGNISVLPSLPSEKPIGLPSELLRRRPDIRKAERELAAATEMVGSAVAALFPRLSLVGFVGDISTQLPNLFKSSSTAWFGGPQLLMPIFNSRMLQQDVTYTKIKVQQACYQYRKTVLNALEETENAIASFHYELEKSHCLNEAENAIADANALSFDLYKHGFTNYIDVIITNRTLLNAEEKAIQSKIDLLLHYIALYKALGGGWETAQEMAEGCTN